MPKRFTDTAKWSDSWFRELPGKAKLLWQYFLDNCDPAGVWKVDFGLASFCIGEKVTKQDALKHFGKRVVFLSEEKMLVLKFIRFQYSTISTDCKMHKPVFRSLEENGLNYDNLKGFDTISIGFGTLLDQEQEKEKKKDQEQEKEGVSKNKSEDEWEADPWFQNPDFASQWTRWGKARRKAGSGANFKKLKGLSGGDISTAIEIVKQSEENGWIGLFELKGKTTQARKTRNAGEYDEHLTL